MLRQRRLSQVDDEPTPHIESGQRKLPVKPWPTAIIYLHALAWIGAAAFIIHYGEIFDVMANDKRVIRPVFYFGIACSTSLALAILYIAFYAPILEKISIDDITEERPVAVYTGILSGCGAWLCFTVAFWPIWGVITPIMFSVIAMALISSTNFLPSF